jgi:uncharacterized protein with PIN domain
VNEKVMVHRIDLDFDEKLTLISTLRNIAKERKPKHATIVIGMSNAAKQTNQNERQLSSVAYNTYPRGSRCEECDADQRSW